MELHEQIQSELKACFEGTEAEQLANVLTWANKYPHALYDMAKTFSTGKVTIRFTDGYNEAIRIEQAQKNLPPWFNEGDNVTRQ